MRQTHDSAWSVKTICITAMFMALNILLSMSIFSIPVPGGHLYLCDVIICAAAMLLDPLPAFCVGGIGSFLGDMLFYPAPMFVSLVTHGLQAVVISLCAKRLTGRHPKVNAAIGAAIGAVIMVVGYSLGRAFVYATPAAAAAKLPYQVLQAAVGAVVGWLLVWRLHLKDLMARSGL